MPHRFPVWQSAAACQGESLKPSENKKREIYGTDVFKKIKANSINEEINAKVVEYKENIWSRMIKFIKKLWHRN